MAKTVDVLKLLEKLAPIGRKMDFDNVGLLVGDGENVVTKILVALDISDCVINEAIECGANLIVSHHPLFFQLKNIVQDDILGRKILNLAKNSISAICMHTNLDVSTGGVNDALADRLGIKDFKPMLIDGVDENGYPYGLGRFGYVEEQALNSFLKHVKSSLRANGLRYVDSGKRVFKVAICGGSGGAELEQAAELGCDTYVTADVKYNHFLDALDLGINLIDAGHFPTENVVVDALVKYLRVNFPQINVLAAVSHTQPELFFT